MIKKMILVTVLALCVGQLVGMQQPEPKTVLELYDTILDNINNVHFSFYGGRVPQDLVYAKKTFNWETIAGEDPEQARLAIDYFIESIEMYADPKSKFKLTSDERQKLMKALEYLYTLKKLV